MKFINIEPAYIRGWVGGAQEWGGWWQKLPTAKLDHSIDTISPAMDLRGQQMHSGKADQPKLANGDSEHA